MTDQTQKFRSDQQPTPRPRARFWVVHNMKTPLDRRMLNTVDDYAVTWDGRDFGWIKWKAEASP